MSNIEHITFGLLLFSLVATLPYICMTSVDIAGFERPYNTEIGFQWAKGETKA